MSLPLRRPAAPAIVLSLAAAALPLDAARAASVHAGAAAGAAPVISAQAAEVLRLVNEARSRPRLCGAERYERALPLTYSLALERAAELQARDMARHGFIEHAGSDGSTPTARVARVGYRWRITGENLALGPQSAREVVSGWLGSPGHCANLMEPRFTELGVALRRASDARRTPYWAMSLAAPR